MGREKAGYRDTIAELNRLFPEQGMLSKAEAAQFLGVSVKTLRRKGLLFNPATNRITKADLARQVCV